MDDIERQVRDAVASFQDVMSSSATRHSPTPRSSALRMATRWTTSQPILVVGRSEPPRYAVCVVLATTRLDVNRTVRKRLGVRKASFAPADVTAEVTGMAIGGVTPFALPPGLPLWIDHRVMERDRIVVGGGSRSAKVVGPPAMLLALDGGEVVTTSPNRQVRLPRTASTRNTRTFDEASVTARPGRGSARTPRRPPVEALGDGRRL